MTWINRDTQKAVVRALRGSRVANNITLREAQEISGVNYSHLCRIERGGRNLPSLEALDSIAFAVKLDRLRVRAIIIGGDLSREERLALAELLKEA